MDRNLIFALLLSFQTAPAFALTADQVYCQDVPNDPSPAIMSTIAVKNCGGVAVVRENVCSFTSQCVILNETFLANFRKNSGREFAKASPSEKTAAIRTSASMVRYPALVTCLGSVANDTRKCPMLNECKGKHDVVIDPNPVPWTAEKLGDAIRRHSNNESQFVPMSPETTQGN